MIGRLLTTSIATGTWGPVKSHRLCAIARRRLGRGASVTLLLTPVLTCYKISILVGIIGKSRQATYHHTEESK